MVVEDIISRFNKEKLCELYSIGEFDNLNEFLNAIAKKRGYKTDEDFDLDRAAESVLLDWILGKIKYYFIPPKLTSNIEINSWRENFNLDLVQDIELYILSKLDDKQSNYQSFESKSLDIEINILKMPEPKISEKELNPKKKRKINNNKSIKENPVQENDPTTDIPQKETKQKKTKKQKTEKAKKKKIDPSEDYNFENDFWVKNKEKEEIEKEEIEKEVIEKEVIV